MKKKILSAVLGAMMVASLAVTGTGVTEVKAAD